MKPTWPLLLNKTKMRAMKKQRTNTGADMHAVPNVETSTKRTQTKKVNIILQNHSPDLQTATAVDKNFLPRLSPQQEVSMRVNQDKTLCNTYSVGTKGVDLNILPQCDYSTPVGRLTYTSSLMRLIK